MMPIADPRRALARRLTAAAITSGVVVALVSWWAWSTPASAPLPPASLATVTAQALSSPTAITPATWKISLWRPFTDAPEVVDKPVPMTLKLFSILQQDDGLTAAIDPGNGSPLIYAHSGDSVLGLTILAIDATGMKVRYQGAVRRVDLSQ